MRARSVASAIAASSIQPSNTGPEGSEKIGLKWSKPQMWSKPASSPMRHTARSSSIVQFCGESLRPRRTGCMVAILSPTGNSGQDVLGRDGRRPDGIRRCDAEDDLREAGLDVALDLGDRLRGVVANELR